MTFLAFFKIVVNAGPLNEGNSPMHIQVRATEVIIWGLLLAYALAPMLLA